MEKHTLSHEEKLVAMNFEEAYQAVQATETKVGPLDIFAQRNEVLAVHYLSPRQRLHKKVKKNTYKKNGWACLAISARVAACWRCRAPRGGVAWRCSLRCRC